MSDRPQLQHLVTWLPLPFAAYAVWRVVAVWGARRDYPYDLEWMEGGMLAHAWRMSADLPVYAPPTPDWIPYVYPPGFASLLSLLGDVFGLSMGLGRSVSAMGTVAAALALCFAVKRHGDSWVAGSLAAAAFLLCYPFSGAFYDLVRPDGLFIGLLAWALVLGLERAKHTAMVAGVLLAAAFTVKHNGAAFGVPLLLGILARDGRGRALEFAGWSIGPALAVTAGLQWRTDGHFLAYLLEVPSSHPVYFDRVMPGTPAELAKVFPVGLVVATGWLLARGSRLVGGMDPRLAVFVPLVVGAPLAWRLYELDFPQKVGRPHDTVVYLGLLVLCVVMVHVLMVLVAAIRQRSVHPEWLFGLGLAGVATLMAAVMRGHHGGFLNVFIHMHWMISLAMGLAVARTWRRYPGLPSAFLGTLLLSGQLGWLFHQGEVERLAPSRADRDAGDLVVASLAEHCDGPVLSPYAAWLPVYAGLQPSFGLIALWDVNHKEGPYHVDLPGIKRAANDHHWACVLDGGGAALGFDIGKQYTPGDTFSVPRGVFMPKSGWRVRPTSLLVPRER
jgi:hypothetical protein